MTRDDISETEATFLITIVSARIARVVLTTLPENLNAVSIVAATEPVRATPLTLKEVTIANTVNRKFT